MQNILALDAVRSDIYASKRIKCLMYLTSSEPAHFFFLLGNPCSLLVLVSPSASHLLALTNCTTFKTCFAAITGDEMAASIHGKVESILFARANSMAHALPGAAKKVEAG